jgi:hypothetical protein
MSILLFAAGFLDTEAGGGEEEGEGPDGPPTLLDAYSYGGGLNFGVSWANGDFDAETEVFRDGSLYSTVGPGGNQLDIGAKSGAGTDQWNVRHVKNGQYSAEATAITTFDGERIA